MTMPLYHSSKRRAGYRTTRRAFKAPVRTSIARYLRSPHEHTFKIRLLLTLSSNSSGIIAGAWDDNPTSFYDFSSLQALFDMYRIKQMKVSFFPHLPNDSSVTTGFFPIYIAHDPDTSTGTPSNAQEILEYENCKIKNMYRPWVVKKVLPKYTSPKTAHVMDSEGYADINSPLAFSSFRFYGDGYDLSTEYGDIIVQLTISCKNRR